MTQVTDQYPRPKVPNVDTIFNAEKTAYKAQPQSSNALKIRTGLRAGATVHGSPFFSIDVVPVVKNELTEGW